jgi:Rap1a immunity proteins
MCCTAAIEVLATFKPCVVSSIQQRIAFLMERESASTPVPPPQQQPMALIPPSSPQPSTEEAEHHAVPIDQPAPTRSPVTNRQSGPDLYDICNAGNGTIKSEFCDVYLGGISLGFYLSQDMTKQGYGTCLPEEPLDVRQTRAIVDKFMRDHPEELNQSAATLVVEALVRAFPCKPPESNFTTKVFYEWCSSKRESIEFSRCALYVAGFLAGVKSERTIAEQEPRTWCLPHDLSVQDAIATYVGMWRSIEQKGNGFGPVETATPQAVLTSLLIRSCEIKK